eukprot:gene4200-5256_t
MGFINRSPFNGITLDYDTQRLNYYRENTQVWWRYTPKRVRNLLVCLVALPAGWYYIINQEENRSNLVKRNPRKI